MMNFNELRNFIIDNIEEATNMQFCTKAKGSRKTETAVFLVEKPETYTLTNNRMIIIKWREISGGKTVRRFVVETWIYAKEIKDIIRLYTEEKMSISKLRPMFKLQFEDIKQILIDNRIQ